MDNQRDLTFATRPAPGAIARHFSLEKLSAAKNTTPIRHKNIIVIKFGPRTNRILRNTKILLRAFVTASLIFSKISSADTCLAESYDSQCENIAYWRKTSPHVLNHASPETRNFLKGIRWIPIVEGGQINGCRRFVSTACRSTDKMPGPVENATWTLALGDTKGWIVSVDRGEFGGEVSWYSHDGLVKSVLLAENSRSYFEIGNNHYILTGLAHLSQSNGSIYRLTQDDAGNWSLVRSAIFGEYVYLNTKARNGCVYLIGETRVGKFCTERQLVIGAGPQPQATTSSFDNFPTLIPSPTNVLMPKRDTLYVGSSAGVIKILTNSTPYSVVWLTPRHTESKY